MGGAPGLPGKVNQAGLVGLKRCFREPELGAPNPSGRALQMQRPWSLLGGLSEPRRRPPGGSDSVGLGWAPPRGPFCGVWKGNTLREALRPEKAGLWKESGRMEGHFNSCPLNLGIYFGITECNLLALTESGGTHLQPPSAFGAGRGQEEGRERGRRKRACRCGPLGSPDVGASLPGQERGKPGCRLGPDLTPASAAAPGWPWPRPQKLSCVSFPQLRARGAKRACGLLSSCSRVCQSLARGFCSGSEEKVLRLGRRQHPGEKGGIQERRPSAYRLSAPRQSCVPVAHLDAPWRPRALPGLAWVGTRGAHIPETK